MFYQIPFLLLLNLPFKETKEVKLYHCDTKDKIDEVENLTYHFKRFIYNDNKIYFIFKYRIIFTDLIDLYYENENLFLVNSDFYESISEEMPNMAIPEVYKVFGHEILNTLEESKSKEYYFIDDANQLTNSTKIITYQLSFNYEELAKPIELDDSISNLDEFYKEHPAQSKYVNLIIEDETKTLIRFDYSTLNRYENIIKNNTLSFLHISEPSMSISSVNPFHLSNYSSTKFFITVLSYRKEKNRLFYFGVDEDTFRINLVIHTISLESHPKFYQTILQQELQISFDFDELFSCHKKFTDLRQIKGIYHSPFNRNFFFIFVKRFYLKIEDDLVLNGFNLQDDVYEKNAHNLVFESTDIVKYENLQKKWVKVIKQNSYLIPNNDAFLIKEDKNLNLEFESVEASSIQNCLGSTLLVSRWLDNEFRQNQTNHLFCFNEETYSDFKNIKNRSEHHSIKSIFNRSFIEEWSDEERLLFIFYDKLDQIVFFSTDHLFVITDNNIELNDKGQITISLINLKENLKIIKNCLFSDCPKSPTKATKLKDQFTRDSIANTPRLEAEKSNLVAIILLSLLILGLVITILLLTYCKKKLKISSTVSLLFIKTSDKLTVISSTSPTKQLNPIKKSKLINQTVKLKLNGSEMKSKVKCINKI